MTATHTPDTVTELVDRAIALHGDRIALVDGPSDRSVDYRELRRRVDRIAGWFAADGVGAGDRIAVWAPNVPPVAAVVLAALRLGAVVVPLSPAWTVHEAGRAARAAGVSVVATVAPLAPHATGLGARRVVVLGEAPGHVTLDELLAHPPIATPPACHADDVAFVCASSGTTGAPKGVVLTHRQVTAVCARVGEALATGPDDVTVAIAPWFHILGLTAELLVPLAAGATVVATPRFDPVTTFGLVERHRCTYLAVPPPVASALARHPAAAPLDLSHLQLVAVGGAPLTPSLQAALAARLPRCAIGQGWGLTETGGALCVPTRRDGTTPGTVGRPLPDTEIEVIDPGSGEPAGEGCDGELVVRGPQVMSGYLDAPAETAAAFTADGWLRTGDLGRLDAAGNVIVTGRLKDLIKVNAMQVAPAEVEDVILGVPGVADAAVVGRPDDRTGETPVAYVVGAAVDLDAVRDRLAERLAPYKRPTEIVVVDRLPRTPSGKLLRRELAVTR